MVVNHEAALVTQLGRIQVRVARDSGARDVPPDEVRGAPHYVRLVTPILLVAGVPLAWHLADRIVWAVEALWSAQTVVDLVTMAFLAALLTAAAVRYERIAIPQFSDHLRQCSLVYWVLVVVAGWTAWSTLVDASAVRDYAFDPYRLPSFLIMAAASNGAILWLLRSWKIADAVLDSRRKLH